MIILDVFRERGRGLGYSVSVYGARVSGLVPNILVHQGERAWAVMGIKRSFGARPGGYAVLLLDWRDVEIYGLPEVGQELEL